MCLLVSTSLSAGPITGGTCQILHVTQQSAAHDISKPRDSACIADEVQHKAAVIAAASNLFPP